jgi:hypothetical protein
MENDNFIPYLSSIEEQSAENSAPLIENDVDLDHLKLENQKLSKENEILKDYILVKHFNDLQCLRKQLSLMREKIVYQHELIRLLSLKCDEIEGDISLNVSDSINIENMTYTVFDKSFRKDGWISVKQCDITTDYDGSIFN